jgi:flagellar protein FlaJ
VVKKLKIHEKKKKNVEITSILVGISIILTSFVLLWDQPLLQDVVFLTFAAMLVPIAVVEYLDYRWRKAVDKHLPDLFRSIVQAQQTGMTLTQAIEEATKRDYGALTVELRKMNAQISWGIPFEEALRSLSRRVNTVLIQRTIPLIIEASRSGGKIEKVFDPMGKFVQTTLLLEKERKTQTRPYIAIIYVAFYVFLFTVVLLFNSFFVQARELPRAMGLITLTPEEAKRTFFNMTAIQAFFSGLIAGKMGEGNVKAGLKHSIILLITGYITLKVFLGG